MKRISVDEVLAAYKATGLKPNRRSWLDHYIGIPTCGCALGVLFLSAGGKPKDACSSNIERLLDLDPDYTTGFVRGFDNDPLPPYWPTSETTAGHADGQAAAAAVFSNTPKGA